MECSCGYVHADAVTHLLNSRFLGKFSSVITDDGLSAQWQIFGETSHDWSVMSSMMGPSFRPDLPRTTLPTEVVMVSTYTSPVVSSLTTWLELTLEMPGVVTSPMDIVPMGISQPTSMTSGVFRQAIILAKPSGQSGQPP